MSARRTKKPAAECMHGDTEQAHGATLEQLAPMLLQFLSHVHHTEAGKPPPKSNATRIECVAFRVEIPRRPRTKKSRPAEPPKEG